MTGILEINLKYGSFVFGKIAYLTMTHHQESNPEEHIHHILSRQELQTPEAERTSAGHFPLNSSPDSCKNIKIQVRYD